MAEPDPSMVALLEEATRDLRKLALRLPFLDIRTDVPSAMGLIGQLQLALRHPTNRGEAAECCQKFIDLLKGRIGKTPAIRRLIELGDDRRHDFQLRVGGARRPVRPSVVCLVGEWNLVEEWRTVGAQEELCGRVVLRPCVIASPGHADLQGPNADRLVELVYRRIDMADEVLVLDVRSDLPVYVHAWVRYANDQAKRVRYWSVDYAPGTDVGLAQNGSGPQA